MILYPIIIAIGKPERMRSGPQSASQMIHNLGMGVSVPTDVAPSPDVVLAVRAHTDKFALVTLGPHDDVLPVVGVSAGQAALVEVLLKVVGVQVGAPAVVASRA